jgi:hypothetical protein
MKKIILSLLVISSSYYSHSQIAKTNIVEHFTNSNCGVCGATNPSIYSTLNANASVLHITYHPSSPYSSCFFSMQNPVENDARTNFYGIFGGTPRVVFNGATGSTSALATNIASQANATTNFKLSTTQVFINPDSVNVEVVVKKINTDTTTSAILFVGAKQDTVFQTTGNGEAIHQDVFRKALSAIGGNTITLPSAVNDSMIYTFAYKVPSNWTATRMQTISILHQTNKQIITANESVNIIPIIIPTAIGRFTKSTITLSPNPASTVLTINDNTAFSEIQIYTQQGQLVLQSAINTKPISIAHLPNGYYIAKLVGVEATESVPFQVAK